MKLLPPRHPQMLFSGYASEDVRLEKEELTGKIN